MHKSLYLVVGLGKTGHSIARFLKKRNQAFIVFDTRREPQGIAEFQTQFPGVDIFLEELPDSVYPQLKEIINSPGVALDNPFIEKARRFNIPIIGDIECLAREITAPVIAITGTNGKSTVTTLLGEMAKAAGIHVAVGGNIGHPVLDLLDQDKAYDLWVLELSSFQLDLIHSLKPRAASILNITPDHLDRHHSITAYIQAKQRIYHQAEIAIYNRQDEATYPQGYSPSTILSYGLDKPQPGQWGILQEQGKSYLACGAEKILAVDTMRIQGQHNWQNALAACALASTLPIERGVMQQVLSEFAGLPHRSQWVRTLDGINWINDSKGTNIGATISAIGGIGEALQGKIVLIAGGQGKGADFTELRSTIANYVRTLVLIGEDADKMENALGDLVQVIRAPSLEEAVKSAQSYAQGGDVVLLSPACASLDMFQDFNHRGQVFTAAVQAL